MSPAIRHLPVLEYLQRQLNGSLVEGDVTHLQYPTAISQLLKFRIVAIGEALATLELDADDRDRRNRRAPSTLHARVARRRTGILPHRRVMPGRV